MNCLSGHNFSLPFLHCPRAPELSIGLRMVNVKTTFGAILAGACLAFAQVFDSFYPPTAEPDSAYSLSGAIALQCIAYFKNYPLDGVRAKTLVRWCLNTTAVIS